MYNKLKADYGKCDTILHTAAADIDAGDMVVSGTVLGMAYEDIAEGETGVLVTRVPAPGILIPKATGVTFAVGARVYWDVADKNANTDSANNKAIGWAYRAAASADTEVQVVLTNEAPVS